MLHLQDKVSIKYIVKYELKENKIMYLNSLQVEKDLCLLFTLSMNS